MAIVQETNKAADDPRWIVLRVSRINLLINSVGVLVALVMLWLVPLPIWSRALLALAFVGAFLIDLRLILLKANQSVAAFYLFDIDLKAAPEPVVAASAKLGIRVRYARESLIATKPEAEGVILRGAFVSPWFTAIRYALPQDPRWRKWWPHLIPLWPDSVAAESFRRVRVALRWK